MEKEQTVLIVDDHSLFREGITYIISNIENLKVVGEAASGDEFLKLLDKIGKPDIVLLDINMPIMDGIVACSLAVKKYPDIKIIALTMNNEQEFYYKMIQAGANGFVLKDSGREKLEEAISEVLNGRSYFPEDILRNIIFQLGTDESVENQIDKKYGLTKREKEVLALVCRGYTNAEIAKNLFLSPKTIEGHKANLLSKTHTKNSAHLVMFAIEAGILKIKK